MRRAIEVFLGDEPRLVGVIRDNAEGARENAAFEYDAGWLAAPDRFVIAPAMPLVSGPQFHKKTRDGSRRPGGQKAAPRTPRHPASVPIANPRFATLSHFRAPREAPSETAPRRLGS
jgi:hypothetical protein